MRAWKIAKGIKTPGIVFAGLAGTMVVVVPLLTSCETSTTDLTLSDTSFQIPDSGGVGPAYRYVTKGWNYEGVGLYMFNLDKLPETVDAYNTAFANSSIRFNFNSNVKIECNFNTNVNASSLISSGHYIMYGYGFTQEQYSKYMVLQDNNNPNHDFNAKMPGSPIKCEIDVSVSET